MSGVWAVVMEILIVSSYYKCVREHMDEINAVFWSAVVMSTSLIISNGVLFASENVNSYSVLTSFLNPVVAAIIVYLNFTPIVMTMINDQTKKKHFQMFMRTEAQTKLTSMWKMGVKRKSDGKLRGLLWRCT